MLAMDIPVAAMAGLVLAEGGKETLRAESKEKTRFMRFFVLAYGAIFIAPTPVYYYLGWPAWEVNFMWDWVDSSLDSPLRAAFSYVLLACAVLPTWGAFEIGRILLRKGKDLWVRIGYIAMLVLTGLIILVLRDLTFNVASTNAAWDAGQTYSFWTHPFVTGWAITSVYFWASLVICYLWLRKQR